MDIDIYRKNLKQKLIESTAKVVYTYTAHWKIADRLNERQCCIKWLQIFFTGVASCGLLSTVMKEYDWFPIVCGFFAFVSLC